MSVKAKCLPLRDVDTITKVQGGCNPIIFAFCLVADKASFCYFYGLALRNSPYMLPT